MAEAMADNGGLKFVAGLVLGFVIRSLGSSLLGKVCCQIPSLQPASPSHTQQHCGQSVCSQWRWWRPSLCISLVDC